jgi:AAA+ ATPase superfamily predicted ATPase
MLVGRKSEISILQNCLNSSYSELIAVYGRRRVGKTYLIRNTFAKNLCFDFSGTYKSSLKEQLKNFYYVLKKQDNSINIPKDWTEAFYLLSNHIVSIKSKKKKVIFIDEFPWLDTRKSNFLAAFDRFWNSFASIRNDLVVVICGSAASYMIKNIIKNKGGLHNRITQHIHLKPFNLRETEQLLIANKVKLTRYEIVQLYMTFGGIPHYLQKIFPGESIPQIIDRLCFHKDGFLRTEFKLIFASLFEFYENHEMIVRLLSNVRKGMTRNEILSKIQIKSGGTLTKTLLELEESGFIEKYIPYKGNKDALFRLTDEYSMFYIKYIESSKPSESGVWMKLQSQPTVKSWFGFSFETICLKHIEQIKEALKIRGVHSVVGSWISKNSDYNAQIDLLIDRDDNVINLCEMKFYNTEFVLEKKHISDVLNKMNVFTELTKTKKSVFITYITTFGLKNNNYKRQFVQNEITINNLFTPL